MKGWPVKDAKARFSELLVACEREGPQLVTKRGVEAAVLVPFEEWRRLSAHARPTLKDLLLSDEARFEDQSISARRGPPNVRRSSSDAAERYRNGRRSGERNMRWGGVQ
jgi:prevent-host-death family protein